MSLIPYPKEVSRKEGDVYFTTLNLYDKSVKQIKGISEEWKNVCDELGVVHLKQGHSLQIRLALDVARIQKEEAYSIDISTKEVLISAKGFAGFF